MAVRVGAAVEGREGEMAGVMVAGREGDRAEVVREGGAGGGAGPLVGGREGVVMAVMVMVAVLLAGVGVVAELLARSLPSMTLHLGSQTWSVCGRTL
jgi:hypothetical protein